MNPKLQLAGKALLVGGLALGEKFRPPPVRGRNDVPISGAHVTAEWLTSVLCADVPGAEVIAVRDSGGSSGTSERSALVLEYNAAGAAAGLPTHVFTKATASFKQRMVLGGAGAINGEKQFYMGLRDKSTVEAPRGYWANVEPKTWRSITLMEDIAVTKGAKFLAPTTGFTYEQILDLVQGLARLHGPLWSDPGIAVLKTPADYIKMTSDFLDIRKRSEVGMSRAHEVMPSRLLGQADRLYEATVRSMSISSHDMPRTLLHGDCHAGQTYVTDEGGMGFGDWAAILQGGWAFDFAYLVNSGCEPADRRAWQDDLLKQYLKSLKSFGGPDIPPADALLAYRQQSFWPYTAWAFTIGRAAYQPEMQPVDTCLAIVHRTATAIDDLDAFTAVGV